MRNLSVCILLILTFLFLSGCGDSENTSSGKTSTQNEGSSGEKVKIQTTKNEDSKSTTKNEEAPFDINDFKLTITPSEKVNSSGGIYYSYNFENNSSTPLLETTLNVKLEFEDGQSLIDNILVPYTLLANDSIGGAWEMAFPEPASKISSYQLVGYRVITESEQVYQVDLQLEKILSTHHASLQSIAENPPFKVEDFSLEVTPTGEINSAGGVYYSYKFSNNSPIPAREITVYVKLEFENGNSQVDGFIIPQTLMNGDSIGEPKELVVPDPISNITSYQLIGYQFIDSDSNSYFVDTQLKTIRKIK